MDDSNFKVALFGGFNKKSVIDYVTQLVNDFNLESEKLKEDYSKKLNEKDEEILGLTSNLQKKDSEIEALKLSLSEIEESKNVDETESLIQQLKEKEDMINRLNCEIDELKNDAQKYDENKFLEKRANKVQMLAKERVNKIIDQARLKIAEEYDKNIEKSNKEGKLIKDRAVKEASQILSDVSVTAQKVIFDFKSKVNDYIEVVKRNAKDIVNSASLIGQKIVKESVDSIFDEKKKSALNSVNLEINLDDFESGSNLGGDVAGELRVEDELMDAVEKLNADLILDEEVGKHDSSNLTESNKINASDLK